MSRSQPQKAPVAGNTNTSSSSSSSSSTSSDRPKRFSLFSRSSASSPKSSPPPVLPFPNVFPSSPPPITPPLSPPTKLFSDSLWEGFTYKLGGAFLRVFQHRYVVILGSSPPQLFWFKSKHIDHMRGSIDIDTCEIFTERQFPPAMVTSLTSIDTEVGDKVNSAFLVGIAPSSSHSVHYESKWKKFTHYFDNNNNNNNNNEKDNEKEREKDKKSKEKIYYFSLKDQNTFESFTNAIQEAKQDLESLINQQENNNITSSSSSVSSSSPSPSLSPSPPFDSNPIPTFLLADFYKVDENALHTDKLWRTRTFHLNIEEKSLKYWKKPKDGQTAKKKKILLRGCSVAIEHQMECCHCPLVDNVISIVPSPNSSSPNPIIIACPSPQVTSLWWTHLIMCAHEDDNDNDNENDEDHENENQNDKNPQQEKNNPKSSNKTSTKPSSLSADPFPEVDDNDEENGEEEEGEGEDNEISLQRSTSLSNSYSHSSIPNLPTDSSFIKSSSYVVDDPSSDSIPIDYSFNDIPLPFPRSPPIPLTDLLHLMLESLDGDIASLQEFRTNCSEFAKDIITTEEFFRSFWRKFGRERGLYYWRDVRDGVGDDKKTNDLDSLMIAHKHLFENYFPNKFSAKQIKMKSQQIQEGGMGNEGNGNGNQVGKESIGKENHPADVQAPSPSPSPRANSQKKNVHSSSSSSSSSTAFSSTRAFFERPTSTSPINPINVTTAPFSPSRRLSFSSTVKSPTVPLSPNHSKQYNSNKLPFSSPNDNNKSSVKSSPSPTQKNNSPPHPQGIKEKEHKDKESKGKEKPKGKDKEKEKDEEKMKDKENDNDKEETDSFSPPNINVFSSPKPGSSSLSPLSPSPSHNHSHVPKVLSDYRLWIKSSGGRSNIVGLILHLHLIMTNFKEGIFTFPSDTPSFADIRRQYLKTTLIVHPDKHIAANVDQQMRSAKAFQTIHRAFQKYQEKYKMQQTAGTGTAGVEENKQKE